MSPSLVVFIIFQNLVEVLDHNRVTIFSRTMCIRTIGYLYLYLKIINLIRMNNKSADVFRYTIQLAMVILFLGNLINRLPTIF